MEIQALFGHDIDISTRNQRAYGKFVGISLDNGQRTGTNGTGGT
jgi:hypothetical protein